MSTVNITWNLSLNIGSVTFIQPATALNSIRTASGFRIDFPASISIPARSAEEPGFLVETMEVCLKATGDGTEIAVGHCPVSVVSGNATQIVSFSWDSTFAALAVYERIRDTTEPQFSIRFKASVRRLINTQSPQLRVATSPAETFYADTTITYSRDSWVNTLRQIGFQDCVICEIPYPSNPPHAWEAVWKALGDARNAFDKGGSTAWNDSARSVRLALESWRTIEGEKPGTGWGQPTLPHLKTWTKEQRLDAIRWCVMNLANGAAHTGAENWTRDEALLLLSSLSALIAVRKP
jgi:hypothetical protein